MSNKTEKPINNANTAFINEYMINGYKGNKAYKKAYPSCSDKTAEVNSCKLLSITKIKQEIAKRMAVLAEKTEYTLEKYQKELESVRQRAEDYKQPSAEVSAIVAKGRSMGYDRDVVSTTTDKPAALSQEELDKARADAKALTMSKLSIPDLKLKTG